MNFDHMINPSTRLVKNQRKTNSKRKNDESSLKVVYISTPMKVKASASRFRSLVQELTGKDSDISQYNMDDDNNYTGDVRREIDCSTDYDHDHHKSSSNHVSPDDTPTSSDYSFGGSMDDHSLFISQMFEGVFSTDSFYDPSEMDVLGSFDELL